MPIWKKNKIKNELQPEMHKIIVTSRGFLYKTSSDLYSKKVVNLSPKDQTMGIYLNFNPSVAESVIEQKKALNT